MTRTGLLLLTGPPGAGKSSVAPHLARDESPSAIVPSDAFFGFLYRGGIDPWLPTAGEQNVSLIEAAAAAAGRLARDRFVVLEGVIAPDLVPVVLAASGLASLDLAVLLPDVETCLERIAARVGHGFADEAAARTLHRQFAASRVDDRHVLTDTPASSYDSAALVRHRLSTGRLTLLPTAP